MQKDGCSTVSLEPGGFVHGWDWMVPKKPQSWMDVVLQVRTPSPHLGWTPEPECRN